MVKVLKTWSQLMGWWQGGRTWLTIPSWLYGGQFVPWHIPAMVCYLLTGHRAQGPTQRAEPRYELIVSVFPMGEEHWLKLAITYHFCKIQMWNPKSGSPSSLEPCLWTFLDFVFFSLNIYQSVTGKHNKRMKKVEECWRTCRQILGIFPLLPAFKRLSGQDIVMAMNVPTQLGVKVSQIPTDAPLFQEVEKDA